MFMPANILLFRHPTRLELNMSMCFQRWSQEDAMLFTVHRLGCRTSSDTIWKLGHTPGNCSASVPSVFYSTSLGAFCTQHVWKHFPWGRAYPSSPWTWSKMAEASLAKPPRHIYAWKQDIIDLIARQSETLIALSFTICSLCAGAWADVVDQVIANTPMISIFALDQVNKSNPAYAAYSAEDGEDLLTWSKAKEIYCLGTEM